MGKYNNIIKEKYNLIPLGDINSVDDYFIAIDNNGYYLKCRLNDLNNNHIPDIITKTNPYAIQNIKHYCDINNIEQILLSNEYFGNKIKLEWFCPIHKHYYKKKWNHFQYGSMCPICGRYNIKDAYRNKDEYLKRKAIIYIIECWNEDEKFYKIGITKNNIKNRFRDKIRMPYNYEIIEYFDTNLYDAIILENKIHKYYDKYRYISKIKFDGHTECFSKINLRT